MAGYFIDKIMRTKGSCRFDPFYKIEIYSETIFAWKVRQKAYPTKDSALADSPSEGQVRILEVSMEGKKYV